MDTRAAEVLAFWFGPIDAARDEWFRKDAAFDALIALRFGALIDAALGGELDAWASEPDSALARIVVLDQFTRNACRDTPRAFAGDAQALAAAQTLVASGQDQALTPLRRVFAYLPFEHAEDLATQNESLRLFAALAAALPTMAGYDAYAIKHHAVIARFGRFPHRNAILGRTSNIDERAFLAEPGSRF